MPSASTYTAAGANDRRTFHAVLDALEVVGADTVTRTWLEEIRRIEWAQVPTEIQAPHMPAFAIGRVLHGASWLTSFYPKEP